MSVTIVANDFHTHSVGIRNVGYSAFNCVIKTRPTTVRFKFIFGSIKRIVALTADIQSFICFIVIITRKRPVGCFVQNHILFLSTFNIQHSTFNIQHSTFIIDQYADNIFRFVLKHTRNKMLADDIVQETFAKVWEKHEDIQVEKAKSYLFTTAYHCLVDVMKKEARSGTIDGIERQGTQDNAHLFDIQKVLQEALERLPEIQKQ